ncbi:uncharacterized protein EAE97_002754 [Botrytis byssoidea]|uniref:Uncharacterized protein n=1 Tax=Botrytis byssoidea TaxID=139641 RepID=A0A9P5IRS2_9HELO|nr:uncharacterized protein EAE97_002754 [Botrytis byssoidea]KAF7951203.1 hypothetical protein EAE97_002754 [Botrytis byssoidea]
MAPFYNESELAKFTQVVREHSLQYKFSKWVYIAVAMTIEQARHLKGGDLFASDPWPVRTYTVKACTNKWYSADELAIPDLMHNYWVKEKEEEMLSIFYGTDFPEILDDVFREIEAELERKKAIQAQ